MQRPKTLFWVGLSLLALTLISARLYQILSHNIYLPIVAKQPTPTFTPSLTPTVTPTPTITPTSVPCPAGTPAPVQMFTYNGVQGNYFRMKDNRNCFNRNEDVWFDFSATNTNAFTLVDVGGMGAYWSTANQASWGDFPFDPGQTIASNDHLNIPISGVYQIRFGICFLSSRSACNANPGAWNALSGPITIVIR